MAKAAEPIQALVKDTGIVVFTCTYYRSKHDLRFQQCLKTIERAQFYGQVLVIVDGSPNEEVHEILCKQSNVIIQKEEQSGGKGVQLRAAAEIASKLPGVTDKTLLCWQEPEKTDMIQCWRHVRMQAQTHDDDDDDDDDVIVPYREPYCFQTFYPIEQYHSETYGNFYLDCVMKDALKEDKNARSPRLTDQGLEQEMSKSKHKIPCIDWHFGPFCFRAKHIGLWTNYKTGYSYDAQLVPIVHAMRKGLVVSSVMVPFQLDSNMKHQEEENFAFIEKRLNQLNDLDPKVKKAWTDEYYC